MGDQAGNDRAAEGSAGKTALSSRATLWKSALVIAPLAGTALFIATGTSAQTSGSATPLTTDATTVAPKPTPEAARHRGGPKGGGRDKEMTGRTAGPATTPDPVTETQTAGPPPTDAQPAARVAKPKRKAEHGRTATTPAPADAPAVERRREGPKGDGESGRTEAPAPDTQPDGRRKEGPKGDGGHGRTTTPPAPDTQPTGRREGPKGAVDHGRTATTPLIIGGLAAIAAIIAATSGSGQPVSR
jgi:hypothetical protein